MRVIIVGDGAMGKLLNKKLIANKHEVVGIIGQDDIKDINEITSEIDVIIDFSHPDNLDMLIKYAIRRKKPIVIATTGFSDNQISEIENVSKLIPILYSANFSMGITIFEMILKQITPLLEDTFDIEIIEKHHNKKIDAPSGTAKTLLNSCNLTSKYDVIYGREGMKKRNNEIGVHSIRGGTIAGEHSVIFAGDDEVLEIKHEAHSKIIFVNGAIKAAEFIIDSREPKLYNMSDVLLVKE